MKNKVKIGQLVQFVNASNEWGKMNPKNHETPLGACITKVMFEVDTNLKPWRDQINEYNKNVSNIKAKFASKVTITENSQLPEHAISAYEYEGNSLTVRNDEIANAYSDFQKTIKAIEDIEVEIKVEYVKNVPNDNMLPPRFVTPMRGIVIEPEYDPNKKSFLAKA